MQQLSADEKESMKTILITGANRGIGLEFCKQYARDGWRILSLHPLSGTIRRAQHVGRESLGAGYGICA